MRSILIRYLFFSFWLTSVHTAVSRSIHVSTKMTQLCSFVWLSNISLYKYTTPSLSIPQLELKVGILIHFLSHLVFPSPCLSFWTTLRRRSDTHSVHSFHKHFVSNLNTPSIVLDTGNSTVGKTWGSLTSARWVELWRKWRRCQAEIPPAISPGNMA